MNKFCFYPFFFTHFVYNISEKKKIDLKKIVKQLIGLPTERDWFEFKENWFDANGIGEYISSLSNTAALNGKEYGFLV